MERKCFPQVTLQSQQLAPCCGGLGWTLGFAHETSLLNVLAASGEVFVNA